MSDEKLTIDDLPMSELLAQMPERVSNGQIVQARVLGRSPDGVLVNIGLKMEGLIPKAEFPDFEKCLPFAEGDTVTVLVRHVEGQDQYHKVSWRAARELGAWEKLMLAFQAQEPVQGTIARKIKGGYVVDIGVDAFLPGSQLDLRPRHDVDAWVGKACAVLITEMDRRKANIVVSRRKLLERERARQREATLASLSEGAVVAGTITSLTHFGAFVDIGGIEGLLHISDMAWHRPQKPEEIVSIGESVQVKVLKFDPATQRISLGLKQLKRHPWDDVPSKYPVGSLVHGKVTSMTTFGAFVEIEPGVEGLVHLSEIAWKERFVKPQDALKVGQEITAKVQLVDRSKEKLSLSIKRVGPSPWEMARAHHPVGSRIRGTVTHLASFGAFVMLPEGIEGLVHISDLSWTARPQNPAEFLQVGQEVEVVVMDVKVEAEKIILSLKHTQPDPMTKFQQGAVAAGRVTSVSEVGVTVDLGDGITGFVRRQELATDAGRNPVKPELQADIAAKVIRVDARDRKVELSIRRHDRDEERQMLKRYGAQHQQPLTLGQVLVDPDSAEELEEGTDS